MNSLEDFKKRSLKQIWLRIFGIKCCLSCKHFTESSVKDKRKICSKRRGEFSLENRFESLKKEAKLMKIKEEEIGSKCPLWE